MKKLPIDINCDLGESYGNFKIGNDNAVFPYLTSCNIACGFHGGDPLHIENTIKKALKYGVRIGAHPAFPDLMGFGRRTMTIPSNELRAIVKYQIAALKTLTESLGGRLAYVKPHGALYNLASKSKEVSEAIINAVREISEDLYLMGLAGSITEEVAQAVQLPFIAEAFADRCYESNGKLRSRTLEGAVIHDAEQAAKQVYSIVYDKKVIGYDGTPVAVNAQSICIHGDNPSAVAILRAIHQSLAK